MNEVRLPHSPKVDVSPLASAFNDVTNSYKFFWFLSILESVRQREGRTIPVDRLLSKMVAYAWFPINYFCLSFGKQDRLSRIVQMLREDCHIPINASRQEVNKKALQQIQQRTIVGKEIRSLGDYVPQRFLRPFFQQQLRGMPDRMVDTTIKALASAASNSSGEGILYLFSQRNGTDYIEITPPWYEYTIEHLSILEGFCLWHLLRYLQKNNPNVPNLASKIFAPSKRDLRRAKQFWDTVLQALDTEAFCIYSGRRLEQDNYTLDHFLPWRFVAHDLLWNIVPATKEANSSKSDSLPDMDVYFEPFSNLQYKALQTALRRKVHSSLIEDYVMLLKTSSVDDMVSMPLEEFQSALYSTIAPQLQLARNMGFSAGWVYSHDLQVAQKSE